MPSVTRVIRPALLALAAAAALASSQPTSPPPQNPPPGYGPGYGQGGYGQGGYGQGGEPRSGGGDYCFTLRTPQSVTSLCGVGFGACERHRQAAVADGLNTTDCVPWSPVACFQLGGDPAADARWCSANLEDCELWRRADLEKHGRTGDACAWSQ